MILVSNICSKSTLTKSNSSLLRPQETKSIPKSTGWRVSHSCAFTVRSNPHRNTARTSLTNGAPSRPTGKKGEKTHTEKQIKLNCAGGLCSFLPFRPHPHQHPQTCDFRTPHVAPAPHDLGFTPRVQKRPAPPSRSRWHHQVEPRGAALTDVSGSQES